jgi:hypothetical protein
MNSAVLQTLQPFHRRSYPAPNASSGLPTFFSQAVTYASAECFHGFVVFDF